MMELDPDKFKTDERFSNHAVQAYSHPDCPIDKGCFTIATGFGGGMKRLCDHFISTKAKCECTIKLCIYTDCRYENTEGCRVEGMDVYLVKCDKYKSIKLGAIEELLPEKKVGDK